MKLNGAQSATIDGYLIGGNIIAAIREYRRFSGVELADAKKFIDRRLEDLGREQPSRFPTTLVPGTLPPQIPHQVQPIPEFDLKALRSTLGQIENSLYGCDYAVTLAVDGALVSTSELPIKEIMSVLYPKSTPHNATVLPVRSEDLMADITECLMYDGGASQGPQFTAGRLEQLTATLIPAFWQQLNALAPLESSTILSYSSDVGLPGYYVFWFFAYLIHHAESRRCIVISGMSSD